MAAPSFLSGFVTISRLLDTFLFWTSFFILFPSWNFPWFSSQFFFHLFSEAPNSVTTMALKDTHPTGKPHPLRHSIGFYPLPALGILFCVLPAPWTEALPLWDAVRTRLVNEYKVLTIMLTRDKHLIQASYIVLAVVVDLSTQLCFCSFSILYAL